jgi:tryptophanyl-tRNA synthetase
MRPAIVASRQAGVESFYFLADYHALIHTPDPARVRRSTLEIAASWLAAGLDADKVTFYRQSDVPEVLELAWLLACVAGKGLLNRAHAYKAAVDRNSAAGAEPDAGVSMGLFLYPLLMAADILLFRASSVPVGRDQLQHIEIARDLAERFNHRYGNRLVLPEAAIDDSTATLPGLDGRKMSKSYGNSIPLFASAGELKKRVFSVVTDSRAPGEPKDSEHSTLFALYQAFATPQEADAMRAAFAGGIAWAAAKEAVFERIDATLAPMRELYQSLVAQPALIEARLQEGAARARRVAAPFLRQLREAVGLYTLFP